MEYRTEHDSMGEVRVESDKYWGAQTQRSFENFKIGSEKMPMEIIYALTMKKKACALTNNRLNPSKMTDEKKFHKSLERIFLILIFVKINV